jgi:thiamine biosynthesis lipoprotein
MKKTAVFGLVLVLLLSSGCARPGARRFQAEFLSLFDTVTTIVGYSDSEAHFREFAEEVRGKIEEYHRLYDIYNDYEGINNVKTVNDNAGAAPVKVDRRIIGMLKFARDMYETTDGAVNVALGAVLKIWHDYRGAGLNDPENAELPPKEELLEAARHTDIHDIVIDEEASTVFLKDPYMRLDVGAVAKGYAAEQVASFFESRGVTSLLISIGGNVRAVGGKPTPGPDGDRRWNIGIQNPDKSSSDTEVMNVMIDGISVVSSGGYERYYVVNGARYHHIIDPKTLMPADYFAQVTILCRDSGLADALSTAVFNMPLDRGRSLIDSLEGVEAAWVLKDGSIEYSDGFEKFLKAG